MEKAADFTPIPTEIAKKGTCCITGIYDASGKTSCGLSSLSSVSRSSSYWNQPEIALANCPNDSEKCGAVQVVDLDKSVEGKQSIKIGESKTKMTAGDACTFMVVSTCKAPTVDFSGIINAETGKKNDEVFSLYYFEYNTGSVFNEKDQAKIQASGSNSLVPVSNILGGSLFPVLWKKNADLYTWVDGAFFEDWQSRYRKAYKNYELETKSKEYLKKIDEWNFFAANKLWTKVFLEKPEYEGYRNVPQSILDGYSKVQVEKTDADGNKFYLSPEYPGVLPIPLAYPGPKLEKADKAGVQDDNTIKVIAGFGMPVAGKLSLDIAAGLGKAFGVKG